MGGCRGPGEGTNRRQNSLSLPFFFFFVVFFFSLVRVFCPASVPVRPSLCLSELDGARLHLYTPRASSPTEAGRWVPEWLGTLCPEATPTTFETRLITVHQPIDDAAACLTRPSLSPAWAVPSHPTISPSHAGLDGPRGRAARGEGGAAWPTLSHRPDFGAVLDAAAFQIG